MTPRTRAGIKVYRDPDRHDASCPVWSDTDLSRFECTCALGEELSQVETESRMAAWEDAQREIRQLGGDGYFEPGDPALGAAREVIRLLAEHYTPHGSRSFDLRSALVNVAVDRVQGGRPESDG